MSEYLRITAHMLGLADKDDSSKYLNFRTVLQDIVTLIFPCPMQIYIHRLDSREIRGPRQK